MLDLGLVEKDFDEKYWLHTRLSIYAKPPGTSGHQHIQIGGGHFQSLVFVLLMIKAVEDTNPKPAQSTLNQRSPAHSLYAQGEEGCE